jgi:hypothetical protein
MRNRNGQMSRSASAQAGEAREGYARTATGIGSVARESKARPATVIPLGRAAGAQPRLTHEQIAERAKTLWLASGCLPGRDEQNWLAAEAQLKAEWRSH